MAGRGVAVISPGYGVSVRCVPVGGGHCGPAPAGPLARWSPVPALPVGVGDQIQQLRNPPAVSLVRDEIDASYRTLRRRIEQFTGTLDAPSIQSVGPVEVNEVYVSAGLRVALRARAWGPYRISHRGSRSVIEAPGSGTSCRRKPPTSRPCDSSPQLRRGVDHRLYRRMSGLRPTQRRRRVSARRRHER